MNHDDTTTLTAEQARAAITDAILQIVPDADLASLDDRTPFRSELELDSLDFLALVEAVSTGTGIRIEEADYDRLTTIGSGIAFLTGS